MKPLEYIFLFLIYPGFLFSATMGLLVGWVDRKVTARLQWRVGPPWYQNFIDVAKLLLYKETLIPKGASRAVFLGMPALCLSGATLASTIVLVVTGEPDKGFIGDIIVIAYLLMIPSLALMLGGFSSANPLASLGASREMKLMLSYELPFILSLIVPVIKSGGAIRLGDIIIKQQNSAPFITSASGAISFLVMLLCFQAKLGHIPFDMAEAETEIISGPAIDYSGRALGMFKLAKAVLVFAAPVFIMSLFLGGIRFNSDYILTGVLEYIMILVLMIVIKNTNPRIRIDQAMRFFWGPVSGLSLISVILAYLGH
jgi:NADH-quinone oxidoreductase subunit H